MYNYNNLTYGRRIYDSDEDPHIAMVIEKQQ